MNEVILIRCAKTWDGESLYHVTLDGEELTPMLTLREAFDVLQAVEKARADL